MNISPRIETSVREISVRIYLDHIDEEGIQRKTDNYDAVCSIFFYGPRAFLYNINGGGFYLGIAKLLEAVKSYGAHTIEGYVVKAHARLVKREATKSGYYVTLSDVECAFDRDLQWITLQLDKGYGKYC
jgi:hypothetical protein